MVPPFNEMVNNPIKMLSMTAEGRAPRVQDKAKAKYNNIKMSDSSPIHAHLERYNTLMI